MFNLPSRCSPVSSETYRGVCVGVATSLHPTPPSSRSMIDHCFGLEAFACSHNFSKLITIRHTIRRCLPPCVRSLSLGQRSHTRASSRLLFIGHVSGRCPDHLAEVSNAQRLGRGRVYADRHVPVAWVCLCIHLGIVFVHALVGSGVVGACTRSVSICLHICAHTACQVDYGYDSSCRLLCPPNHV